MKLQFIDIPGFEEFYSCTNDGRILSKRRNIFISHYVTNSGYKMVDLTVCGKKSKRYIHRVVCECFHGKPKEGFEVSHNDGNKLNNCASNLRWDTREGNFSDKKIHGTETLGELHGRHKLKEFEVLEIRAKAAAGAMQKTLAAEYGVWPMTISRIVRRINWGHI